MNNASRFKEQLEKERETVVSELGGIGVRKNSKSPDDWQGVPDTEELPTDPNEVADRIESYEGNTAIVNELEQRLMEIDRALGKIEKGTFGVCEVDGKPIEEDRLAANPAARTCKEHLNAVLPETPDLG